MMRTFQVAPWRHRYSYRMTWIMASRRSTILAHCVDWKPGCAVVLQRRPDYAGGLWVDAALSRTSTR